jgi:hypothetical protein
MTAFRFKRRGKDGSFTDAEVGSQIQLYDGTEYVLSFLSQCGPALRQRIDELGGECLGSDQAIISFGNYIGHTELAGVKVKVISRKLGEDGQRAILRQISELSAGLPFEYKGPTSFEVATSELPGTPVQFHQLKLLRQAMLGRQSGERLQDWIGTIERNPTRRIEPERPVVTPDRVRRLDHRAVQSIFSRVDRLVPVPAGASIANTDLARSLKFAGAVPHFPAKIAAPRGRLSLDTPENRFVKHVIGECLSLVFRFVDHPKLPAALRDDCRKMLYILEPAVMFMAEAGRLSVFLAPSQALAKGEGYRDVFDFWGVFSRHVSLPPQAATIPRLLEARDMALLYEYWVFLKVLQGVVNVTGGTVRPVSARRNELGEWMERIDVTVTTRDNGDVRVRYNPTFSRWARNAYSAPMRPDVVVECGNILHAFDAKYRLDRFCADEGDPGDDSATYMNADLHKMHTYRDAVEKMRTAFVVYPGTGFEFFERAGGRRTSPETIANVDGVGAVPLRPDAEAAISLRILLKRLLAGTR